MSRRHWGQTREIHNPANEGGIDTRTVPAGFAPPFPANFTLLYASRKFLLPDSILMSF